MKLNLTRRASVCLALLVAAALVLVGCGSNLGAETPVASSPTAGVSETRAGTVPSTLPDFFVPVTPLVSPIAGSTVGSPFLPGEVLAELPVYPGATPTTLINPGSHPPSFPMEIPIYLSKTPGYQSTSAQYTVDASVVDILAWYRGQLALKGYRTAGESGGGDGTIARQSLAFFPPSQPLVSVQVHVYTSARLSNPVFELLVTYTVPLPRPPEETLPDDVDSVTITFAPGTEKEVSPFCKVADPA